MLNSEQSLFLGLLTLFSFHIRRVLAHAPLAVLLLFSSLYLIVTTCIWAVLCERADQQERAELWQRLARELDRIP